MQYEILTRVGADRMTYAGALYVNPQARQHFVRSEVLTAVIMKFQILWDVTPRQLINS